MTEFRESRIEVAGCEIEMRRGGSGQPLMFLHGAGGAGQWGRFHDRLAERFDVMAPSHPGFDGSDDPPWLDNVGDLANFYLDLMTALDLDRVHLVGLSLGGWISAELAVRNTSRLATLTLMGAAGIYVEGAERIDTFLLSPQERARRMFHDPEKSGPLVASLSNPDNADAIMKNQQTAARVLWQPRSYDPNLRKWLHRIDRPTLALWGASDPVFPPVHADAFAGLVPGARKVILPECGHLMNVEQPDAAADAIISFIGSAAKSS